MTTQAKAQAAMDELIGVGESQPVSERAGRGGAKPGWDEVYTEALAEARSLYPTDGLAAHRAATATADRVMRMNASRASSRSSQEILVDAAFVEIFGGIAGGAGGRFVMVETFPDRVIARGLDGKFYKITYSVGIDGVTFGAPQVIDDLADEQQRMAMGRIELAEMQLAVARRILRAQELLRDAVDARRRDEASAFTVVCSALLEYGEHLAAAGNGDGVILCGVQQSEGSSKFLAREAAATGDGWTWPVQVMRSGWAAGVLDGANGTETTRHFFPREVVASVAEAVNGARFRRKHPASGDGSDAQELTAGWVSGGHMSGSAAVATINLLKSAEDVRSMLLAAQEAGRLNLFSVSIFGYFSFKRSQIDGKPALVADRLQKFVGLDMVAEPGAGGRFLGSAGAN